MLTWAKRPAVGHAAESGSEERVSLVRTGKLSRAGMEGLVAEALGGQDESKTGGMLNERLGNIDHLQVSR